MNLSIFIFLVFVLQGFYWLVGQRSSKNLKNKDDYFLAGKQVQLFPLMMTFLATQVGGGLVLGAADEAYVFGWPVLVYPLGASLGLILLGLGLGRKLAGFQVSTVAQIFEVYYKSAVLKKLASLLSILSLFMILVAQIIASSKFLASLGFCNTPLFMLFWTIVMIYTVQGGLKAVISTDIVQAVFFSAIFLLCFALALYANPSVWSMPLPQLENFTKISSKLCGWFLMPLLFMIIEQDMGQRCFAGASAKVVSKAALLAGLGTMIVCIVPIFFGTLAKTIGLDVPKGNSVLMTMMTQTSGPWMSALVGCAVLAAIISTATSLINAISSNLSSDFNLSWFEKINSLGLVKGMTCVISIASIFFAFYFDNIVDLLIQSYELSVSCLFIPIIMALFKKRGSALSAWMAICGGALGFIVFRIYPIALPKEIASLCLSSLGYLCAELLSYDKQKEPVFKT